MWDAGEVSYLTVSYAPNVPYAGELDSSILEDPHQPRNCRPQSPNPEHVMALFYFIFYFFWFKIIGILLSKVILFEYLRLYKEHDSLNISYVISKTRIRDYILKGRNSYSHHSTTNT